MKRRVGTEGFEPSLNALEAIVLARLYYVPTMQRTLFFFIKVSEKNNRKIPLIV